MGTKQSQFAEYKNGFDEVETKIKWKKGLIVDIKNKSKFVVIDIRGIVEKVDDLRIDDSLEDNIYIYYYTGNEIIVTDKHPGYEIYMKELNDIKIGGGRRKVNPVDFTFDDVRPNFVKAGPEFTVKRRPCAEKVTCDCARRGVGNGIDDNTDDNIASDDE